MNTKQLRQKILELAIRGKLVPQDPNDEPASILLERVRAEKERLIKEGKIKRDKKDSVIFRSDDKLHYEQLPDGWARVSIETLFSVVGGGTPATNKAEYWGEGMPWFSSADIDTDGSISPRRCVTQRGIENSATNVVPKGNIVVVTRVGLGKVAILDYDMCFSQDNQALIPKYPEIIFNRYLFYFLFNVMQSLKHSGRGTTISGITKKQLTDIFLLLPPLAEQGRIVSAVESAFAVIDEIEHNKLDLQSAVAVAKSKVLSLAVCGKLVPQDPRDEPASVLLERIRTEREALIKTGKLKHNKNESTITRSDDNSYYEKIDLDTVCNLLNTPELSKGTLPYLEVRYLRHSTSPVSKETGRYLKKGAPIILVDGENSGEVFFAPEEGYMGSTFRELSILDAYYVRFIILFISYYQKELRENKTGSAIPHLNRRLFAGLPLPLMSLNRQRETVSIVEAQFELLNSIVAALN